MGKRFGAELVKNSGEHLSDLLVFSGSSDRESVGGHGSLYLGVVEMDNSSVVLDHVHLLNTGNVRDRKLFQVALQLLVVGGGGLVHHLLLSAGGTLATSANLSGSSLELLELFGFVVFILYDKLLKVEMPKETQLLMSLLRCY